MKNTLPKAAGIGLRAPHYKHVIENKPDAAWFEVHSENFFADGGAPIDVLKQVREHYPLSIHGVGLSLGRVDGLDENHLKKIKRLVDEFNPALVSEHISWSAVNGLFMNDLLPIPYTKEAVDIIVKNVNHMQDYIGRQILVENPSTYLEFKASEMSEYEFMKEVAAKSGCGMLFDVNNIYVCSQNHGYDPYEYIENIPVDIVQEIHLAGHEAQNVDGEDVLIDTHSTHVIEPVWDMYKAAIKRFGKVATLIEWDAKIPEFVVLQDEAKKAQEVMDANG